MNRINVIALANTFALIDIVLHPLFRVWVWFSPESYEGMARLFVAGLQLEVEQPVDLSLSHLVTGTLLEAVVFWSLGAVGAMIYNKFLSLQNPHQT